MVSLGVGGTRRCLSSQWPAMGGIVSLTAEQVWEAKMTESSWFAADE